jgi:hypothetical protein
MILKIIDMNYILIIIVCMDKITISQKFKDPIVIRYKRDIDFRDETKPGDRLPFIQTLVRTTMELERLKKEHPYVLPLANAKNMKSQGIPMNIVNIVGEYKDLKFAINYLNVLLYGQANPPPLRLPTIIEEDSSSDSEGDDPRMSIQEMRASTTQVMRMDDEDSYSYSDSDEEPDNFYI